MADIHLPRLPEKFRLTPEFKLLTACSWIAPPSLEQNQAMKIASQCREDIDWDIFVSLVRRHGVPSLAYTMLSRHAGDLLPGATREILKANHIQAAGQSMLQATELIRLSKLFSCQGIEFIPLKGVFLSHQLYGDMGVRSSCDLDVLVLPEHVELVENILAHEGYFCEFIGRELTSLQKQHVRGHMHHYHFTHKHQGLHLELHWNLGTWLPEQMMAIFNHVERKEWLGISAACLDDASLLLTLCDHGARHDWVQIKWLSDVARIIAFTPAEAWETIISLARELDLLRVLAQSSLLVYWIYGIALPQVICNLINQDQEIVSLSEHALKSILMNSEELASPGKRAQRIRTAFYMKRLRPSLPYSLVFKSVLVPLDVVQAFPLPNALFWLYYPLRPLVWLWRNYLNPAVRH